MYRRSGPRKADSLPLSTPELGSPTTVSGCKTHGKFFVRAGLEVRFLTMAFGMLEPVDIRTDEDFVAKGGRQRTSLAPRLRLRWLTSTFFKVPNPGRDSAVGAPPPGQAWDYGSTKFQR